MSNTNPLLDLIWHTESGDRMRIGDMAEDHAKAALAYVMDKIHRGHPVWTDPVFGQFHYDSSRVLPRPVMQSDLRNVIGLYTAMREYLEDQRAPGTPDL